MAFLDETGLAELWSIIKEKDDALAASDAVFASGSITPAARFDYVTVDIGFVPDMVIIGNTAGGKQDGPNTEQVSGGILWNMDGNTVIYVTQNYGSGQRVDVKVNGSVISATYSQNPSSYGTLTAYWLAVKFR